ncbi:SLC13 family permease [Shinella sp. BYT-45]|uniref:SLC13 family permease n=1 Tax=Shinella sp. BYT-45 TaxID=3377377 RepID=UPI003981741C
MNIQILSIVLLAGMFVVATIQPINMGALAFACAFLVGSLIMAMKASEIFAGFPSDLFLTLVGITYLFAIAQINGTIDWLVEGAVKLVRGHVAWIPWVMFLVAAVITGFGALGPAAVAILAPVALGFAFQYRISPVLMGLMVIHGAQAGGFSPISVYGGITNQIVEKAGLPLAPTSLFLSSFFFNLGIAVVVFFVFGGWKSLREGAPASGPLPDLHPEGVSQAIVGHGGTPASPISHHVFDSQAKEAPRLTSEKLTTLVGLTALAVGALVFKFNVGLVAITVAVALALMSPKTQKAAIDKVSWSTVLLISGIITYVGVMEKIGTIDYVADGISSLGMPLLVALLLCFTGAIVSAFASSTALLGAIIPLAVPFLLQGQISAVGVVAAIAISTTIVDTSPFSTNGALVVANAQDAERESVLRSLLVYSAAIALIGPVVAWLVLVVPGLV